MQPLFDFFANYIDITLSLIIIVSSQWVIKYFANVLPKWSTAHKVFIWSIIISTAYYFLLVKTGVFKAEDISKYAITYFFSTSFYELAIEPLKRLAQKFLGGNQQAPMIILCIVAAATLCGCNTVKKTISKTTTHIDSTAVMKMDIQHAVNYDSSHTMQDAVNYNDWFDTTSLQHVKVWFRDSMGLNPNQPIGIIWNDTAITISAPGRNIAGVDASKESGSQKGNSQVKSKSQNTEVKVGDSTSIHVSDSTHIKGGTSVVTTNLQTRRVPVAGLVLLTIFLLAVFLTWHFRSKIFAGWK